jgi:hypothetical protein
MVDTKVLPKARKTQAGAWLFVNWLTDGKTDGSLSLKAFAQ